ncbi:MAG TPA: hypothetical protein VFA76_06635 [Terriglobales bacterium]|nr:hypothetical protein [Terriglobales bacterium]
MKRVSVLLLLVISGTTPWVTAQHLQSQRRGITAAIPLHTSSGMGMAAAATAGTSTLKHWSSSFVWKGTTYHYTMVGTNPWNGSATTTISTEVQPLKVVFSNGATFWPPTQTLVNSPLFLNTKFPSETGQYGDIFQRANFWTVVSHLAPNYHVKLGQPSVRPIKTIHVPAMYGSTQTWSGTKVGLVQFDWLTATIDNLAKAEGFNAATLPIFLVGNVFGYTDSQVSSYYVGYHSSVSPSPSTILTYIFAAWNSAGLFTNGLKDMTAISHEVAEWINDPFVNNIVPGWSIPINPGYCVSNLLEVGDPIDSFSDASFPVTLNGKTYHPQDEAYFSWFAHQSPSKALHGQYSYIAPEKLKNPSPYCQ